MAGSRYPSRDFSREHVLDGVEVPAHVLAGPGFGEWPAGAALQDGV